MHPACALCRGACCESIVIDRPTGGVGDWLALHGHPIPGPSVELPVRCTRLTPCGGCSIWQARPAPCVDYAVGGAACRATILRRRQSQALDIYALLPEKP